MSKPGFSVVFLTASLVIGLGTQSCTAPSNRGIAATAEDASATPEVSGKLEAGGGADVREDVQRAIEKRYPGELRKRGALLEGARALEGALKAGSKKDAAAIDEAAKGISSALYKLHEVFGEASDEISFLESIVINSDARSEAYIQFNSGMNGKFFGGANSP